MNNYEDIINLKHHESQFHPRMSLEKRSAQFAPFAALTGFENKILETARTTTKRIELDDSEKEKINNIIKRIQNKEVAITYFKEDKKKEGGNYITNVDIVKKIDDINKIITFNDNSKININDIISIIEN